MSAVTWKRVRDLEAGDLIRAPWASPNATTFPVYPVIALLDPPDYAPRLNLLQVRQPDGGLTPWHELVAPDDVIVVYGKAEA